MGTMAVLRATHSGLNLASLFLGGASWASLVFGIDAVLIASALGMADIQTRRQCVDLHYGAYLFGEPVEQLLEHVAGAARSPIGLFAVTRLITLVLVCGSWILVEWPSKKFECGLERCTGPARVAT